MAYTTIDNPKEHFVTKLYTGSGGTQNITGLQFSPDFIWLKALEGNNYHHNAYDSLRGATKALEIDDTDAEATISDALTSINSDGFSLGADGSDREANESGQAMASWNWRGSDSTGAANTDGTIDSVTSANTTAGFSVVSWTNESSGDDTVGHGLGVAPKLIITKVRSATSDWYTHTTVYDGTMDYFKLNDTTAVTNLGKPAPTSTVFTTDMGGTTTGIAYCFANIKGYQQIGVFTGNANVAGNFVYTGFKPAFLLFKNANDTRNWGLIDSTRSPTNKTLSTTEPDKAAVTNTSDNFDFFSNGFRAASTDPGSNGNGNKILYMAIAENPFVSSKGIPVTAR